MAASLALSFFVYLACEYRISLGITVVFYYLSLIILNFNKGEQIKNKLPNNKNSVIYKHSKEIVHLLTKRPEKTDNDGHYDFLADEAQMIEIVSQYLNKYLINLINNK